MNKITVFWILTLLFFPFWIYDAFKTYDTEGAIVEILLLTLGWIIVFPIACKVLEILGIIGSEINHEIKKSKMKKKLREKQNKEVKVSKNENTPTSGTAFFVDKKGHVITNHHVIKGFENKAKIFYENENIKLKHVASDESLDLALLKANVKNTDFITITNKNTKKMQNIVAAGYPLGKHLSDDLKFTSGIISSLKGPGNNSAIMQIDAALNPGNSGGPIVDKQKGYLTGVAVSGLRKDVTEGINYGIKASRVKEFLESNRISLSDKNKIEDVSENLENATVYIFCE